MLDYLSISLVMLMGLVLLVAFAPFLLYLGYSLIYHLFGGAYDEVSPGELAGGQGQGANA